MITFRKAEGVVAVVKQQSLLFIGLHETAQSGKKLSQLVHDAEVRDVRRYLHGEHNSLNNYLVKIARYTLTKQNGRARLN